mgnify:CR=1 FL=1
MIYQKEILLPPFGRGFHLITNIIVENLPDLPEQGIISLFLQHTSAGLTISENFDTDVRTDLSKSFDMLVPEGKEHYSHTSEGPDDMPAHIKSTLTSVSLTIPVRKHQIYLGKWQGIYLCEFRNRKQQRKAVITILS